MRARVGRQLGKFSRDIERVTVRLEDVNGPRGGVDVSCRLKVVLSGRRSVVVEERAESTWQAFMAASDAAARSVRKTVDRTGSRTPKRRSTTRGAKPRQRSPEQTPRGGGSLIGRRVGRAASNLTRAAARPEKLRRDVDVDTSEPQRSASDRRVGAGRTATRNTKLRSDGMSSTLEDSETGKPSRKSTRRSANRAKASSNLERREQRRVRAPGARAARAKAAARGVRGKR